MNRMHYLIGVDDTDGPKTDGTGYFCRILAKAIEESNLGKVESISRHQLLLSKKTEYTNRNNSACLEVFTCNADELIDFCSHFLKEHAAKTSRAVMIFAQYNKITEDMVGFGLKAKRSMVKVLDAKNIAKKSGCILASLNKDCNGAIGALAAIGLRATGDDGRVIWAKGKELLALEGTYNAGEVYSETNVDSILTLEGYQVPVHARISINDSMIRPIFKDNNITLMVKEAIPSVEMRTEFISTDFVAEKVF